MAALRPTTLYQSRSQKVAPSTEPRDAPTLGSALKLHHQGHQAIEETSYSQYLSPGASLDHGIVLFCSVLE